MTEEKNTVPQSSSPVTGGKESDRASTGNSRAGHSRAILYAIAVIFALALCVGAYYVAGSSGPPGNGDGIIPVPGHPELTLKPVDAFYTNGTQIYVLENSNARDPVYGQMMSLIQDDPSVYGVYTPEHSCSNFAVELIDNAERCNIRAHLVILTLSNSPSPHAIVAFNTTDEGMVYIDNTGLTQAEIDKNLLVAPRLVNVTTGSTYIRRFIGFDIDEDPGLGIVDNVTFLS